MHNDWQLDPRHSGSFARLETLLGKLQGFHALIVQHNNPAYRDGVIHYLQQLQPESDTLDLKALGSFEAFETTLTGLAGQVSTLHVINLESWDETQRQAFFRGINYHREYIAHQLNATLVLWLVEPHIRDMALQAADFWAWREQVLDFALPLETSVRWDGDWQKTTNLDQTSKRQRIQEIHDYLATQQDEEPTLTLADMQHELGNLYWHIGEYDTAQQYLNAALANFAKLDERHAYARVLMDKAYLRFQQGEPAEALDDLRTKVLPWFIKLNDLKQQAETQGRIADILQARGQLDEALNIRQTEELPVYEKLGDVREKAVTMGKIADILQARGQLDEALNIRENHELPVYEKLGDVRSEAVTMGKIADILQARGQLDEALNIRQTQQLPVYEKLGDVRSLLVGRAKLAMLLWQMDAAANAARVQELLCLALTDARRLQIPEAGQIEGILMQMGLSCDGEVNPNLFRTLEDGEALYPDHCDSNAPQAEFSHLPIRYFSGNKTITLWTALTLPAHGHQVDEELFLRLLLASVSLEAEQKAQIINSFAQLEQEQVDGLLGILQQEAEQLSALTDEHKPQMDAMQDRKLLEWVAWENQR